MFEYFPRCKLNNFPARQSYCGNHQQNLTHQESIVKFRKQCWASQAIRENTGAVIIFEVSLIIQSNFEGSGCIVIPSGIAPGIYICLVEYTHNEEEVKPKEQNKMKCIYVEKFTNHLPLHCNIDSQYWVTQQI